MPNRNIYNGIIIIIVLNSIYDNFEIKTSNFFKIRNKLIDEIQQIFYFVEVKYFSKQAIGVINNLSMLFEGLLEGFNKRYINSYLLEKKK